jgi:hypothetical protein
MSRRYRGPDELVQPIGDARRVLAYRLREQRAHDAARVAQNVFDNGEAPPSDEKGRHTQTNGGDEEKLRGIPAIGRGVGGTMRGSDPYHEVARRDQQRRRAAEAIEHATVREIDLILTSSHQPRRPS